MKIKTWQYILIGLLILGAVGGLALSQWLYPYSLKRERAAARAAGLPLTAAELVRPKPPAARDAGPEWLAISDILEKRPFDTKRFDRLAVNGRLPEAAMPEVRRALAGRQDLMARIHAAAAKPEAYFEHDFEVSTLSPLLSRTRTASKLLRWEARSLAFQGRYAEAVRVQELGLNVADQLASEPTGIGMLVSVAANTTSTAGMRDILRVAGPDPRVATMVEKALRRHPPKTRLANVLKGEVLIGSNAIQAAGSNSDPISRAVMVTPNQAAYLHWMVRLHGAAGEPHPRRLPAVKRVAAEVEAKAKIYRTAMSLTRLLVPVMAKAEARNTLSQANHALTLAVARVMAFRGRNGRWPENLSEAAPDAPADPFTGRSLGYRIEGQGFVVFSAGEDGSFAAQPRQAVKDQSFFRYREGSAAGGPVRAAVSGPGSDTFMGSGPDSPPPGVPTAGAVPMPGNPPMPGAPPAGGGR